MTSTTTTETATKRLSSAQRNVLCWAVAEHRRRLLALPAAEGRAIGGLSHAEREEFLAVQVAPTKWRTALSLVCETRGMLRFLRDTHGQPVTHCFLPTEAGLAYVAEIA